MHVIHTIFSTYMSNEDYSIRGNTYSILCDTNVGVCSPSTNVLSVYVNCCIREGYAESCDQPLLQQVSTLLHFFDSQLANHLIFTHPLFTEISLSILESEYAI